MFWLIFVLHVIFTVLICLYISIKRDGLYENLAVSCFLNLQYIQMPNKPIWTEKVHFGFFFFFDLTAQTVQHEVFSTPFSKQDVWNQMFGPQHSVHNFQHQMSRTKWLEQKDHHK